MYNECVCLRTFLHALMRKFAPHLHCITRHTSFKSKSERIFPFVNDSCWLLSPFTFNVKREFKSHQSSITNQSQQFHLRDFASHFPFFFVCHLAQTNKLRCDSNDDFFNINHFDISFSLSPVLSIIGEKGTHGERKNFLLLCSRRA